MQNGFELGSVFPGPLQDPATLASTDTKAAPKNQSDKASPASGFHDVFDAAQTNPFHRNGSRSPEDDAGRAGADIGRIPSPEDDVFDLQAFFGDLASGEIDIGDFFPAGSQLSDQISSKLPPWSQSVGHVPIPETHINGPYAADAADIMENLKSVAAALPSGSDAHKAVLGLQDMLSQFQRYAPDPQQITRWTPQMNGTADRPLIGVADPQAWSASSPSAQTAFKGQGDGAALAQAQAAPPPPPPQSEPVAPGSVASALATQKGAGAPLTQAAQPIPADQSAQSLSALMKDVDDTRRLEAIKPATHPGSASYGGLDIHAPRPGAVWSNPAAAVSASSLQFGTFPSEPFATDVMSSGPVLETSAREGRTANPAVFTSQMPGAPMAQGQPQQIVRQIAIAIQNKTSGTFDISLSPAELGNVRISLTTAETGMIVNIQADRQETLDLLRRHADSLAADFRELGYDGTSFSFEGSDGQHDSQHDGPGSPAAVIQHTGGNPTGLSVPADPNAPPAPAPILIDGSVDIRI